MQGIVFDIKKYAIHDGPGIRTTVFLKGCPLKCAWCHNPESIKPEVETLITLDRVKTLSLSYSETKHVFGKEISDTEIFKSIKQDILFYEESGGGVTFSGGEPFMQAEFLLSLLKMCKNDEIHTAIDTSGFTKWANFEKVLNFTDLFLFDLKLIDENEHLTHTRVSNKIILENLQKLSNINFPVRIRIPLIPEITDTEANLNGIANFIKNMNNIKGVDILPFNVVYESKYQRMNLKNPLQGLKKQSDEKLNEIKNKFTNAGFACNIGG